MLRVEPRWSSISRPGGIIDYNFSAPLCKLDHCKNSINSSYNASGLTEIHQLVISAEASVRQSGVTGESDKHGWLRTDNTICWNTVGTMQTSEKRITGRRAVVHVEEVNVQLSFEIVEVQRNELQWYNLLKVVLMHSSPLLMFRVCKSVIHMAIHDGECTPHYADVLTFYLNWIC